MSFVSGPDLAQFIAANYFTFLLLGGMVVVMLAYRDVHLPAARNFNLIVVVLFLMSVFFSLERWAALSPERVNIRLAASIAHYILQPLVIYLELIIIMPDDGKQSRRSRVLLALPLIINTLIYTAAPFAGDLVFCYDEHYWFCRGVLGYSIYVVTFIYLALLLLWSALSFRNNDRRTAIILSFMVAIAVLTGLLEGLNLAPGYIDEAFTLGVFLYYIYLITVHESQMQASLAKKELELSQNKVRLLREQIQPHFIFNSLQIIKSLIRSDQSRAVTCLEDFSDYLRANLDAITSDKLIPFDTELQHIEAFVSLALADDSKNIDVLYDIEERFFKVPPLTIEPLVENAIRHGLSKGGTVVLSTRAEDDNIVIRVTDDGEGFDISATDKEKARVGTGLANVRTRLAELCGAGMKIESSKDGTVVTVKMPV